MYTRSTAHVGHCYSKSTPAQHFSMHPARGRTVFTRALGVGVGSMGQKSQGNGFVKLSTPHVPSPPVLRVCSSMHSTSAAAQGSAASFSCGRCLYSKTKAHTFLAPTAALARARHSPSEKPTAGARDSRLCSATERAATCLRSKCALLRGQVASTCVAACRAQDRAASACADELQVAVSRPVRWSRAKGVGLLVQVEGLGV